MSDGKIAESIKPLQEDAIMALKFPCKLWRIVNECKSGAVHWGHEGSSIIVDYYLFQTEYLIPMFKTKSINSFVRQLNMYGFRKIHKNSRNRFYIEHEFQHEFFRYGRPDLLCHVKRHVLPLKSMKFSKLSKLERSRRMFEGKLLQSNMFAFFWNYSSELFDHNSDGTMVLAPAYKLGVVSAKNVTLDFDCREVIADLETDYEGLVHEPRQSIEEPEESEVDDAEMIENLLLKKMPGKMFGQESIAPTVSSPIYFQDDDTTDSAPEVEEVKKEQLFDEEKGKCEACAIEEDNPLSVTVFQVGDEDALPTMHFPDTREVDDLFSCLANAITIIE